MSSIYAMFMLIYTLSCSALLVSGQEVACPYKICSCGGNYIFCNDKNLTEVPAEIAVMNPGISCLDLDGNKISEIRTGSLPANLTLLTLQMNPLEFIIDEALDESSDTLETLKFCNARFEQIPNAALALKHLKYLSICHTYIDTWDEIALQRVGSSMVTLDLNDIGLREWPTWLRPYTHLTELQLAGGSISHIPEDALDMVRDTLVTLGLQNNSLTSVPKAISKLTALRTLNLQENRITNITWLPQLSKLSSLLLGNNFITNGTILSNALQPYASTLYTFSINGNLLTSIPDISFLPQLVSIDFTNNHISDINSGALPLGITEMILSRNFLPSIPLVMKSLIYVPYLKLNSNRISVFRGVDFPPSAYSADFGYNLLTELTKSCFPVNSSIAFLILSDNPITHIAIDAFTNVPNLVDLTIQHSKLTRLPMAVASLNYLRYFDISDSGDLLCTCLEKSLASWIKVKQADNVLGNCGSTSIYVFFTELSSDCP